MISTEKVVATVQCLIGLGIVVYGGAGGHPYWFAFGLFWLLDFRLHLLQLTIRRSL